MANPAASVIIGLARDLIRAESGSDVPTIGDAFMLIALSDANREWLRAFRKGGGNTPSSQARETGYTLIADTTLSEDITTATTDFDVAESADHPSTGGLVIWDGEMFDICYYTGNAADNFTGVSGIAFSHEEDDAVQALYALPSNFKNFRHSDEYGDGVSLNGSPLYAMEGPPSSGHFSVVDDGTTKYLWLPRGSTGEAAVLYDKVSATIDSTDDTVDVPEDYQFFLVWRCIENALFGRGDMGDLIGYARAQADKVKLEALKERNVGRRVRIRPLHVMGAYHNLPDLSDE